MLLAVSSCELSRWRRPVSVANDDDGDDENPPPPVLQVDASPLASSQSSSLSSSPSCTSPAQSPEVSLLQDSQLPSQLSSQDPRFTQTDSPPSPVFQSSQPSSVISGTPTVLDTVLASAVESQCSLTDSDFAMLEVPDPFLILFLFALLFNCHHRYLVHLILLLPSVSRPS